MWKIVIGLSVYQIVVTYILYFVGPKIFPSQTDADLQQLSTLVFNAYVWMQIFTILKCVVSPNTCLSLKYLCLLTLASQLSAIRQHSQHIRGDV